METGLNSSELKLWNRFHIRLSLLYGLLVLAVLVVMSIAFYHYAAGGVVEGVRGRLRDTSTALAAGIRSEDLAPLTDASMHDSPAHRALLARMELVAKSDPDISDVYIMRKSPKGEMIILADYLVRGTADAAKLGDVYAAPPGSQMIRGFDQSFVEMTPYTDAWGTVLSGFAPIRDAAGTSMGLVGIDIQVASVNAMKSRVRNLALLMFVAAVLALVVLGRIVAGSVRDPLNKIVQASSAITSGQPGVRTALLRKDEFGVVGRHFDEMASGLEERDFIKATFGTYVSPEVVKRVLEEREGTVAGQQREVTVLFSDLRSFTTITEKLTPHEAVSMLNDYLERMSHAVVDEGGRIDKFIGDALMADWGALESTDDAAGRGLRAALQMHRALKALNKERAARNEPALKMGIGVHKGSVIAGSIGSQRKLEFTVIGDAVNVASRLEGLSKLYGASIVASRAVIDATAKPPPHRRIDRAIVAGKSEPIDLVEVLDADDPRVPRIESFERGMTMLLARQWEDAVAAFEEAGAGLDDPAVTFQLARANQLRSHPDLAAVWDGVERRAK